MFRGADWISGGGGEMVVLLCKKLPQLVTGNIQPVVREIHVPVMMLQAKLFISNYTNRVVHVFKAFLQTSVHKCINLQFWSSSYCKQSMLWPLLR